MKHIELFVEGSDPPGKQPVEVEVRQDGTYRILYSPGFVEGIAAGDTVRLIDQREGSFEVVERGGNVSIKLATTTNVEVVLEEAEKILSDVDARLDGAIDHAAVWTVSANAGFPAIEECMEKVVSLQEGTIWWYGNVYDESGSPLNWW